MQTYDVIRTRQHSGCGSLYGAIMGRKNYITASVVGLVLLLFGALVFTWIYFILLKPKVDNERPPNVVLIMADDLGYGSVSWNANPRVAMQTPYLEGLAREGVILDQNYMQPACSPSRAAIMMGRYPFRFALQGSVVREMSDWCLPDVPKLPELLQDNGYKTHLVGKWHLGYCNVECTPLYQGFDSFYGILQGGSTYYNHTITSDVNCLFCPGGGYDFRDGDEIDFSARGQYATDLYTERAVQIISETDPDQPFFLLVSHQAPHTPLDEVPQKYLDLYPDKQREKLRAHFGLVSSIDVSTEAVVSALKARGLYNNTIIIFSSDNGGSTSGSSYPFRGRKGSVYEGGTRVPGFIHSPLLHKMNYTHNGMMHAVDWFNTLLAMTGAGTLEDVDSIDQSDMLLRGGPSKRTEMVYNLDNQTVPWFGAKAYRHGDYKLIVGYPGVSDGWEQDGNAGWTDLVDLLLHNGTRPLPPTEEGGEIGSSVPAILAYAPTVSHVVQLYNLQSDPEERHNLAASDPDTVARLQRRLVAYEADMVPSFNILHEDHAAQHENFGGVWSPGWC